MSASYSFLMHTGGVLPLQGCPCDHVDGLHGEHWLTKLPGSLQQEVFHQVISFTIMWWGAIKLCTLRLFMEDNSLLTTLSNLLHRRLWKESDCFPKMLLFWFRVRFLVITYTQQNWLRIPFHKLHGLSGRSYKLYWHISNHHCSVLFFVRLTTSGYACACSAMHV